ncbi:hypothetical protein [Deinococcus yunweiensis]|uniref:hypothetical protein n=1 Tax=Deinococcus yunweiensis TaxID=367282 RepID=UPI00398F18FD
MHAAPVAWSVAAASGRGLHRIRRHLRGMLTTPVVCRARPGAVSRGGPARRADHERRPVREHVGAGRSQASGARGLAGGVHRSGRAAGWV